MKKGARIVSLALVVVMLLSAIFAVTVSSADDEPRQIADLAMKELKLWYDEPAPDDDNRGWRYDDAPYKGWESQALPIGNAYLGAKVFGLTERERIQISENSLSTSGTTQNAGTTSFTETYLHFNHTYSNVSGYYRDLSLNNAVSSVEYAYGGVTYTREYFASYPDKVMVIKLVASGEGNLTFTLEPKIPFYVFEGRTGDVTVSEITKNGGTSVGTLTLEGNLPGSNKSGSLPGYQEGVGTVGYDMDFEAQYRVFANGGTMTSGYNTAGGSVDSVDEYSNGTITVTGADSAYIVIALGTNYELDEQVFLESNNANKLQGFAHPHEKVSAMIEAASEKSYDELKAAHVADYKELFDRVVLDLGGEIPTVTTDVLIDEYQRGKYSQYLEELMFHFGRYLLIASSREGQLPPNLNGIWNRYHTAICLNGYWGNVNIQMNFWSAFNTNLAECFESYVGLYNAYLAANTESAKQRLVQQGAISSVDDVTGELWSMETGMTPFYAWAAVGGRDGWGNTPYMAESFWDYYDYTRDEEILKNTSFPALLASANFLSYIMQYDEETGFYLTPNSGSPEQSTTAPYLDYVSKNPGYVPVGSTYDQGLTYSNYLHVLEALEVIDEATLTEEQKATIARIREQVDKLDPIPVGWSGQVKEFREENYYGEIGEPEHRHISHLAPLHPASVINNVDSPAWLDASRVTMIGRGNNQRWGWSYVLRILEWARIGDAEKAYEALKGEIINTAGDNLCTLFNGTFQVEGNLGTPSAITEMLLQSHEGYIAPLAAIPEAWADGAYKGLVARGAFEVSAAWSNGHADEFEILSKAGGDCSVKYINVAKASVKDSKGNDVAFTSDGNDIITFNTVKGETYTITLKEDGVKTEAPAELTVNYTENGAKLDWEASSNGKTYNVYRATNSNPKYDLVASGVKGTSYDMAFADFSADNTYTYAVSAVSADGRESARDTVTMTPILSPKTAKGFIDGSELTVYMDKVDGDVKYRIYEKAADGSLTLLRETEYTTAVIKNASFNKTYVVKTAIGEMLSTETTEVLLSEVVEKVDYDNLFLEKPIAVDSFSYTLDGVTYTAPTHVIGWAQYPVTNVVDGNYTDALSRWAFNTSKVNQPLAVKITLDKIYSLNEIKIYAYGNQLYTDDFAVQTSVDGVEWKTVLNQAFGEWSKDLVNSQERATLDLNGATAKYVRIIFNAKGTTSGKMPSILEIMCSGSYIMGEVPSKLALQAAIDAADLINIEKCDGNTKALFNNLHSKAVALLESETAGKSEVLAAVAALNDAVTAITAQTQLKPDAAENFGLLDFELDEVGSEKYETRDYKNLPGWEVGNWENTGATAYIGSLGGNNYLNLEGAGNVATGPYFEILGSTWRTNSSNRPNIDYRYDEFDFMVLDFDFTSYQYVYTLAGVEYMGTSVPDGATNVRVAYPTSANTNQGRMYPIISTYLNGAKTDKYSFTRFIANGQTATIADQTSSLATVELSSVAGEWNHVTFILALDHEDLKNSKMIMYINGVKISERAVSTTEIDELYFIGFRIALPAAEKYSLSVDNMTVNYYGSGDGKYQGDLKSVVAGSMNYRKASDMVYGADYVHPDGSVSDLSPKAPGAEGYINGTELTVYIEKVDGAEKYRIYEKNGDKLTLLSETKYAAAVIKDASLDKTYVITAVVDGVESRVTKDITLKNDVETVPVDNVFVGKPVSQSAITYTIDGTSYKSQVQTEFNSTYVLSKIVDGDYNSNNWASTRVAFKATSPYGPTVNVNLGKIYTLDTFSVNFFASYSETIMIEVSTNGVDYKVAKISTDSAWGNSKKFETRTIELGGVEASHVRITFNATNKSYSAMISIMEIMCSGSYTTNGSASKTQLSEKIAFAENISLDKCSAETKALYKAKLDAAIAVFENKEASETEISSAVSGLDSAMAAVNADKNSQLKPSEATNNGALDFNLDSTGDGDKYAADQMTNPGWTIGNWTTASRPFIEEKDGNKYLTLLRPSSDTAATTGPYFEFLTSNWRSNSSNRPNINYSHNNFDYAVLDFDFTSYYYIYSINGKVEMGTSVPSGATDVRVAYPSSVNTGQARMYPIISSYSNGAKTDAYSFAKFTKSGTNLNLADQFDSITSVQLSNVAGEWNHYTFVLALDHDDLKNSKMITYINGVKISERNVSASEIDEIYFVGFRLAMPSDSPFALSVDNMTINYYGNGDGSYNGSLKDVADGKLNLYNASDVVYNSEYIYPNEKANTMFTNRGYTLLLEGITYINKYIAINAPATLSKDVIANNGGVLIWNAKDAPASLEDAIFGTESYIAALEYSGKYQGFEEYVAKTLGIAAKEMGDVIYFRPYTVINGIYTYGELECYSVKDYCEDRIANSSNANLKAALKAMLNYGAASQIYFGYNTENLANASLSEEDKALSFNNEYLTSLIEVDENIAKNFASTGTLYDNGNTLKLEGATSVKYYVGVGKDKSKFDGCEGKFYFWTEEDYLALLAKGEALSIDNATYVKAASFGYAGSAYGYEYSVESEQFVAKELGKTLFAAFAVEDADGFVHCSGIIEYSPEAYAEYKLGDGVESEIDNLVKRLVVYGEYAKIYLENK